MRRAIYIITEHSMTIGLGILAALVAYIFGHAVAGAVNHALGGIFSR